MYNLTDVINSGKSDWANMQKKLLKESAFPNSPIAGTGDPNHKSAYAYAPGAGGDTTDDLRQLLTQNIKSLENTPAFTNFREKNLMFSNDVKNELIKKIGELKAKDFAKDKGSLLSQLGVYETEYTEKIKAEENNISKNVENFNKLSDEVRKRFDNVGLGVQFRSFPTVNNKNEFSDAINLFQKTSPTDPSKPGHIVNYLLPQAEALLTESDISEAKIRVPPVIKTTDLEGPGVSPTTIDPRYKGGTGTVDPKKDPIGETIRRFVARLSGIEAPAGNLMKQQLASMLKSVKNIEVYHAVIEGIDVLKSRLQVFADKGRKGAEVTNAKFKLANEKDNAEVEAAANDLIQQLQVPTQPEQQPEQQPTVPEEPTGAPMNEEVSPRTKRGPGKVFDVYADQNENVETAQDVTKKKLQNINEGWKKYSEKKTPNKQKPDDFTLIMG